MQDGRGRQCTLVEAPRRIISLVPSTTETLHALGVADAVVGVTRFCVRPSPWVKGLPKIGGTKDPNPEKIAALKPDFIVANCEENTREAFEALDGLCPIWAAFPKDVDDALADLTAMGSLVGASDTAATLRARIERQRHHCHQVRATAGTFRYAWLIWRDPWMTVSDDTFVASMMAQIGGRNAFAASPQRFPTLDPAQLASHDIDVVLLSSEPFPFKPRHAAELATLSGLPEDRFRFVDGQFGTWHGVRMEPALQAFARYRSKGWPVTPGESR